MKYKQISTEENYNKLLKSGLFFEFYPELEGDWDKDKSIVNRAIKPDRLLSISLNPLYETVKNYIDYVWSDNYHEDNDYDHYIFESALTTLYGDDIFDKINKRVASYE